MYGLPQEIKVNPVPCACTPDHREGGTGRLSQIPTVQNIHHHVRTEQLGSITGKGHLCHSTARKTRQLQCPSVRLRAQTNYKENKTPSVSSLLDNPSSLLLAHMHVYIHAYMHACI